MATVQDVTPKFNRQYSYLVNKLREHFLAHGFVETHPQSILSILAACEDPNTIAMFKYLGKQFPLPQTGQMNLEHFLLTDPDSKGMFCVTTSYREEKTPVQGRHDFIFPMFEWELHGKLEDLIRIETDLLTYLGYTPKDDGTFPRITYANACKLYGVDTLEHEHELFLERDFGPVVFLTNFPEHTSPFWNMARGDDGTALKVDVIISGIETFGSAQRCTDVEAMKKRFHEISEGQYAETLYGLFGKERVTAELDNFLALPMIHRCGGGMGIKRLMKSMDALGLFPEDL